MKISRQSTNCGPQIVDAARENLISPIPPIPHLTFEVCTVFISTDVRLETEAERRERIDATMQVIDDLCAGCGCTPLDVAESLGFELTGARIVN